MFDLLSQMMLQYHQKLSELEVRVAIIMTKAGRKTDGSLESPAVTKGGVSCAGVTRLTTTKERVLVNYDAVIEIDEDIWEGLTSLQQRALIDHELEHIQVVYKDGFPDSYDDGRPKLKLIVDDWTLTGFRAIVARHGESALEYNSVFTVAETISKDVPSTESVSVEGDCIIN